MPQDLISLDRFRAALRDGTRPNAGVYRLQVASPLLVDEAARKVRFVFNDGTLDRVGDTIDPQGWQIADYLRNPVVLWAHESWSPPIARGSNLLIEGMALAGDVEFAAPEVYEFADLIYRLVKAKYLNAGSVGFLPLDYSFSSDEDRQFGIDFERQELLEFSICPVPANPNALAEARAHGIDTRPLVDWAEKLLDGEGRVILPRTEVERMRSLAQPLRARQRAGGEEWHVAAARDLPLDDSDAWDGPAAAKRMLDAAGFDGDSPHPATARRGFLIYDGAALELRGSYKLPFADIVDGRLKAVKGGIKAAASRLPQTDAPQDVLDDARKVVDHYEERFGMGEPGRNLRRRDGGGMSEGDPAAGGYIANCGRAIEEECGLKNPEECAIDGPLLNENKGLAALLRHVVAGVLREAGMAAGGEPQEHLKRAREHVKAAHDHHRDLMVADPSGGNAFADPEAGHKAVCGMHAHAKAADTYLGHYRGMVGGPAGKGLRRREAPINPEREGLAPEEHLKRAHEHVKAMHEHLKDLIIIDPDGDEDLTGNDDAQQAVRGMHAHAKAADGYLEAYRSALGDATARPAF